MKILIITYSREVNPGTFLQAYGVQHVFRQLYPEAQIDLIKHKRMYSIVTEEKNANNKGYSKLSFIKAKVLAIPRRIKYEIAYRIKFHLTEQEFGFFDYNDAEFKAFAEGYDLIVVGSDTILINLEKNGHYGLMWLRGINTKKILFAASAAPANFVLNAQQRKDLYESFSTFNLLGVRDMVTKHLIRDEIGMGDKVYTQYDPTYLIPESEFSLPYYTRKKLERIRKHQKVALVNFSVIDCPFKKEITEFLKRQGYYTISTLHNKWGDYNLMSLSPFEWAALFRYVDLTVTERFHDSVFTLRNGKPVVAVDWKSNRFSKDGFSKTQNLLSLYGLDCNHFIATSLEEAETVMDHIKGIPVEDQKKRIKKHNLKIVDDYSEIIKKLNNLLTYKLLGDYNCGRKINLIESYLSSLKEQYNNI